MEIYLKLNVDREEGKQMSAEAVGDELLPTFEGEQIDVGDSVFSITSVEVVASPKGKGPDLDAVLDRLLTANEAFFDAHPISLDGPATPPTDYDELRKKLQTALVNLFLHPAMGDLMLKAKVRRAKAKA